MAISWKYRISRVKAGNNYNISADVTDDTKPEDSQTENVSIKGKYETDEEKAKIHRWLKEQYEEKIIATDAKVALAAEAKIATEALFTKEI